MIVGFGNFIKVDKLKSDKTNWSNYFSRYFITFDNNCHFKPWLLVWYILMENTYILPWYYMSILYISFALYLFFMFSRFSKYVISHRNNVEIFLCNFLDSINFYNVIGAAKCAQALQQVNYIYCRILNVKYIVCHCSNFVRYTLLLTN